MGLALLSRFPFVGRKARTATQRNGKAFRCRPFVEGLEDRVTPATLPLPIDVDFDVVGRGANRALEAVFSLGDEEVTAPVEITTSDAENGDDCPILNLEVGAIDLNLLGLVVETSDICLEVTATDDEGLLGSLLCDLSGGGLDLGDILDELGGQANRLLDRLEGILDNLFNRRFDVTGVLGESLTDTDVGAQQNGDLCDILNLSLGPVDLDIPLLGVNVLLDDCEGRPVTVDVLADPEGGLLGDLLCGLADGIDLGGLLGGLNLDRILGEVDRLLDRAVDLVDRFGDNVDRLTDRLENLFERFEETIDRLVDRTERIVERVERTIDRLEDLIDRLGDNDRLDRVVNQLGRVVDRLEDLIGGLV